MEKEQQTNKFIDSIIEDIERNTGNLFINVKPYLNEKIYEEKIISIKEQLHLLLSLFPKNQDKIHVAANDKSKLLFDLESTKHITDLKIINYKGLQNISIHKLNKINVFAGENNSGKTSLLEAVRLLIAQNDANDFLNLQQLRGKFSEGELNTSWVIDNVKSIEIEGEFGAENNFTQIKINPYREQNENINSANYLGSVNFSGHFAGENYDSILRLFERGGESYEISAKNGLHHLCAFAYYTPFAGYRNGKLYDAHAESTEKKYLPKIIKFLQASIDEDITNILLVEKNGLKRFLVEHKQFDTAMDLVHFGDGLQNIFKTAMLFATAQNGIVLIDEMGTAIHYSLLTQYTKFIQQLAEAFNTQVFITSHSDECIDAFVDNDYKNDDISMYNLEVDGGKVLCKYMSGNRFRELNELVGIDLRK